jgi:hypothetical protein
MDPSLYENLLHMSFKIPGGTVARHEVESCTRSKSRFYQYRRSAWGDGSRPADSSNIDAALVLAVPGC